MKVLVIGGGGREHALAWKIAQSPLVEKVYCAPGNAGTDQVAENVAIPADDLSSLLKFALQNDIGLTVVGPEQPLAMGIVDRFNQNGLRIFGPNAEAAQLEGSKAFSKDMMRLCGIPTSDYQIFDSRHEALEFVKDMTEPLVVKADGLAAGKGVVVCVDGEAAVKAIEWLMELEACGDAGKRLVIEKFLQGQEVSVLAFSDGKSVLLMESAQDHKAVFDGDHGPNTGGMGAFSPASFLTEKLRQQVEEEIMLPTIREMAKGGRPFKGILYAGLMLTDQGPMVLEFNARFGDPETQPLMMRMENDIVPVFEACIDGTLDQVTLTWKKQSAVCVAMAAEGYPGSYKKGLPITGLEQAAVLPGVVVFHAGTKLCGNDVVTNGGRVLGVTALAEDTPTAIDLAYQAVDRIKWDGVHYRKDIGKRGGLRPAQ
jgi:phosphoribosylamine--glycine ligase